MKNRALLFAIINSFIVCQFLFFIDEGFNDFRWMADIGNWIVFAMYFITVSVILFLINLGLERLNTNKYLILGINLIVFPILIILLCCTF